MDDHGGPAFPAHEQWNEWSDLKADYVPRTGPRGGMSLRDYFASQVSIGLTLAVSIANAPMLNAEQISSGSYAVADAMLKAREGSA